MSSVRRVFVEKMKEFDSETMAIKEDINSSLGIRLENVRTLNRYDVEGLDEDVYLNVCDTILSEPNVDNIYHEEIDNLDRNRIFGIEYLPGQYNQRADWAQLCSEVINGYRPKINSAKIIIIGDEISDSDFEKIKSYLINKVDSREASLEKPTTLEVKYNIPDRVEVLDGFINLDKSGLEKFLNNEGLAMTIDDLVMIRDYFKIEEKRNPTITEIKVLDTYWSDHCRHTTFMTKLNNVSIKESKYTDIIKKTYDRYLNDRKEVYLDKKKNICLMDIAVMAMKKLKKEGRLNDLDESEEINACSINIDVSIDGVDEKYLLMFKNETHNHPTEIEPFGGAATCLGGAIRDPLSGRSYVYQAMRVTGAANPHTSLEDTLNGKLMQKKITQKAADGYSSYGNQIGLCTGQVHEVYDEGFVAKRMEVGAVIAAVPKENVIRKRPEPGDIIILLGGKTGRDGCGGATGSSKEHSEESIHTCSAEVQKGDAPNERKIQRFFRNKQAAQMIKRCNDFGAGGVSVAIGEICDSLDINLDLVPKKYEGLDGTELAISESQERMAVCIERKNLSKFIELANQENIEATHVADVTDTGYLRMFWNNSKIVDIKREFLNTNGCTQSIDIEVDEIEDIRYEDINSHLNPEMSIREKFIKCFEDLNVCSQRGLIEKFDNTIGANTVIAPLGGRYQRTEANGMVCKIPVLNGETNTSSIMTFGYNPKIGKASPFHGALNSVIESVSKVVSLGGDYKKTRLTFQEYFERLGKDPKKWGKPFSALLGAYHAQMSLNIAAIGGKDSMSGTFKDLNVPPTLISFAVCVEDAKNIVSQEFKKPNNIVVNIKPRYEDDKICDIDSLKKNYDIIHELILKGFVLSSYALGYGGIGEAIVKMGFGNGIGFEFSKDFDIETMFEQNYGSILLEIEEDNLNKLDNVDYEIVGKTREDGLVICRNEEIELEELYRISSDILEPIFPTKSIKVIEDDISNIDYKGEIVKRHSNIKIAKPRVFIPVFPGTNCEYDTKRAFDKAGAISNIGVFRNLTYSDIEQSIDMMVKEIKNSQIVMIPGGFSAGDEPDGSAKFISTVFRNSKIEEAIMDLLYNRDGLMLGICNGFQALIKLGLLPYGEIIKPNKDMPTLTYNNINRHQAKMVRTRISSNKSPWLYETEIGDIHTIAISHGEGKFVANKKVLDSLISNGQIATQYVDLSGRATYDIEFNPNGSTLAIEGITSKDGRILGKMGHSERIGDFVGKNIEGNKDQKIFISGVRYFD